MDWTTLTQYQTCQCCGQPLDGFIQRFDAKYNIPDKVYVTCRNRDCGMWDLTYNPEKHQEECSVKSVAHSC